MKPREECKIHHLVLLILLKISLMSNDRCIEACSPSAFKFKKCKIVNHGVPILLLVILMTYWALTTNKQPSQEKSRLRFSMCIHNQITNICSQSRLTVSSIKLSDQNSPYSHFCWSLKSSSIHPKPSLVGKARPTILQEGSTRHKAWMSRKY